MKTMFPGDLQQFSSQQKINFINQFKDYLATLTGITLSDIMTVKLAAAAAAQFIATSQIKKATVSDATITNVVSRINSVGVSIRMAGTPYTSDSAWVTFAAPTAAPTTSDTSAPTVLACDKVENAKSVTCTKRGNSRAVCGSGYILNDNTDEGESDACEEEPHMHWGWKILIVLVSLGAGGFLLFKMYVMTMRKEKSKTVTGFSDGPSGMQKKAMTLGGGATTFENPTAAEPHTAADIETDDRDM